MILKEVPFHLVCLGWVQKCLVLVYLLHIDGEFIVKGNAARSTLSTFGNSVNGIWIL